MAQANLGRQWWQNKSRKKTYIEARLIEQIDLVLRQMSGRLGRLLLIVLEARMDEPFISVVPVIARWGPPNLWEQTGLFDFCC